ncbi:MAG: tetratricopeptide repeat protein [Chloroflexaceae bacterium]|nr:tetratricopeptide repeat protein [Chloroflexaceae bacterium]
MNPRSTGALNGLGFSLDRQGSEHHREAIAWFEESLRIWEDQDVAHNGLGWSLYNWEEYTSAETHFRRAIELQPNYANAFYGLGLTLEELGRPGEAERAYRQALVLSTDDVEREEVRRALDRLSVK